MASRGDEKNQTNPLLKANSFSKFFFWWLTDIIWYSQKHDLTAKDLYDTIPEDLSEPLTNKLELTWTKIKDEARKRNETPSLWKTVAKIYFWDFLKLSIFPICFTATQIVLPELIQLIMSYFRPVTSVTTGWEYVYGTTLLVIMVLRIASLRHGLFNLRRLGMRARIAFTSLIYEKMIRLPSSAKQKMTSSFTSLLSIDVGRFELLFYFSPFLFTIPLQLLIEAYLIWRLVGLAATIAGITFIILLTFPVQVLYSKVVLKFRAKQSKRTDDRVSLIGEIIDGMKAVKMYVWEKYLEKLVHAARRLELQKYSRIFYTQSIVASLAINSYRVGAFMVTLIYAMQYGVITADKIIPVTLHLFNLRQSIGSILFFNVRNITDMYVSMKRIQDFLLLEESHSNIEGIEDKDTEDISIKHVTAYWDEKSAIFENISLTFAPKKFYAIVGSVGSGKVVYYVYLWRGLELSGQIKKSCGEVYKKFDTEYLFSYQIVNIFAAIFIQCTFWRKQLKIKKSTNFLYLMSNFCISLLKLILSDLKAVSGKVSVYGRVSYASQEPWLFNASVRDNILFGERYEEDRYQKVVNACALIDDFTQFPYGDKTSVGDRGSNLSGGQCARINLARVVYRDSDIYLLDNPLSAVDARVAKKIMGDCLNGLLKDKTRILVTHGIQQLADDAEIILLKQGQIEFRGSKEDFEQSNLYVTQSADDQTELLGDDAEKLQSDQTSIIHKQSNTQNGVQPKETEKLISKEATKINVYSSYIRAGTLQLAFSVVFTNFLFAIITATFDYGLGAWTRKGGDVLNNMEGILSIFGSLIALVIFTMILKGIFFFKFTLKASKTIHNSIFSQMIMTNLQFFDKSNSAGRLLNRFSEDMAVVDNALPLALFEAINMTISMVALLLPAIIVNWWIMFPYIISTFTSIWIGKRFVRTIQSIKKLAASAKSPILSYATSSLAGVTTIRACRAEKMVTRDFRSRQDHQTKAQFLVVILEEALTFWLEFNNFGLLATIIYFCIYLKTDSTYEGHVGLTIMQILNIILTMGYTFKHVAESFGHMTSVERIVQLRELESETLIEDESSLQLTSSWPDQGQINFEHLYLRYSSDNDPVLWDINCAITPGTKVGIVGRTGAGKSSLISALFRFAKLDGSISIDGVNTKTIDLYKLRSKISIIPQEPLLFKGTLRKNLDLSGKLDDASLWSALEDVELKHIFDSLDFSIERGGSNLSAGQRQLLCLARAILIKNKILILDEVTANVDSTTDAVIQKTIRNKFKECTVLTIAHRLNTVMDSDKILVLDSGRVVEYDHPFLLLQNRDSYFFKMVEHTDNATKRQLNDIAKKAYENL